MDNNTSRILRAMNDTVCTFEVTGNEIRDVELCLTHGIFISDVPQDIKRRYDQILGIEDTNQLVKVKGNMPTLEETTWLLRNMDKVHSISINTSPTARLEELNLELKFSACNGNLKSLGGTDFISINQIGKFISPSEAVIDLQEEFFIASHPHLFLSINVPTGSFFYLSFVGCLRNDIQPLISLKDYNKIPRFCMSCGAPLHDRKCNYCGVEY